MQPPRAQYTRWVEKSRDVIANTRWNSKFLKNYIKLFFFA
jgi:hypothetical protein